MEIRELFKRASREISSDLNFPEDSIKFQFYETRKVGIDYVARVSEGYLGFDFHVRIVSDNEDPFTGKMDASLNISYDEISSPFFFYEKIDYKKDHPISLSRWGSWAIHNYRKQHQRINFNSIFKEKRIFVYGFPKDGRRSVQEARYLVNGILATTQKKTVIYKIRHIRPSDLYRSYSYAIYVENPTELYEFWCFFPDVVGIDSGGWRYYYIEFEELLSLLKSKIEVVVHKRDCDYQELRDFLKKNSYSYHSISDENVLEDIDEYSFPNAILKESKESYENFIKRYEEYNYSAALRDLRALVQQALENLLEKYSIDYSHIVNPSVSSLAYLLVKGHLIDGRLYPWFEAFASIASLSSHKDYPTDEDTRNSLVKNRILLTINIGVQLLNELAALIKINPRS